MNLSKRLEIIASLIPDNVSVIDVGCDHAYLDIYLSLNRENVTCMACDINKNALDIAKKNIEKYNLKNKINTYLCDGITGLNINEKTIIVISGMGTSTVLHILDNELINNAKEIIIQSNNNLEQLRLEMVKRNFYISDEKVVFDKGKYYVIIVFKKGIKKYKKIEFELGPILIKNKNKNYFKYLLEKEKDKYKKIPFRHFELKFKTFMNIKKIMGLTK